MPEIVRTQERAATDEGAPRPTPVAASAGYAVPRTVTVTYTGNVPVASDAAPRIAMEVAPATSERPRVLALSVDPLGIVKGNYGASVARRLSDHAALRIDGQFNRGVEGVADSSSWRVGVSVPLYLNETFQGPFVEVGVAAAHRLLAIGIYQDEPYNLLAMREYTAGPEVFVGWQRLFGNGFHIAVAVGATADWTTSDQHVGVVNAIYGSAPLATLGAATRTDAETYVRVGYAF
ncbi:MAG: hypothetical protein HOV81_02000 [Kofleriaceae bacterium]|nr:hypothetical protein [Kofleriaceae bacterium]